MKHLLVRPSCFHHLISFDPAHNSLKKSSGSTVPIFHHLWIDVNLFKNQTAGSKPEDHQLKTSILFKTLTFSVQEIKRPGFQGKEDLEAL